jgi:hypothetical protein
MKLVVLILALSMVITAYSEPEPENASPGPTIGIKIIFGKKKLDCLKFGICDVIVTIDLGSLFGNNLTAVEDRVGYGYASATEASRFIVRFVKDYMTQETKSEFFVDGKFIVGEDYVLPPEVCRRLGLRSGYTIKEGVYKYSENSEEIILIL